MKEHHCLTPEGGYFIIWQNEEGGYRCPVCGSAEFDEPLYYPDASPSLQKCSCGFEFGFDDSKLASQETLKGIVENWDRWRIKVIKRNRVQKLELEKLEANLQAISYKLAFDLIPVRIDENT